ncbi:MAG: protocatechuate 3,4-dioxygenase, partial [Proteobacteria bacterium]|nr:protocatechuate 3,4-dioxygenase [Pseudomonadota bacterium]
MAKLVGGLGCSHVPSIGAALDRGLADTPDWKPFFDGIGPGRDWVRANRPDIAVVIFNDHGNSYFSDRVPTFAIGCAERYALADEGWGPRPLPAFDGHAAFGWHLADTMVGNCFDPEVVQEIEVDHGLQVPMELFWGRPAVRWPVRVVPIFVNVIQQPIPLPVRCHALGAVLRQAIESFPGDERIVVVGTGGLSHQLQGTRAGFIN